MSYTIIQNAAQCRFCGARNGERREYIRLAHSEDRGTHKAYCWNCAAATRECVTPEEAEALWNSGEYTVPTHSEKDILKNCLGLMHEMAGRFEEYLEYMGYEPENKEEKFCTGFTYFHIVQRLFLWSTHHSGGTSTGAKCRELGIKDSSETVTFGYDPEEADDEEED